MKPLTLDTVRVADLVPEGTSGAIQVQHFTVTKNDADRHNGRLAWRPGSAFETIEPGRYARLLFGGEVMMSDTQLERRTNWEAVHEARGDVLVAGLGLGLILYPMIVKPEVRSITVVEKFHDVVKLVWPHVVRFRDQRRRTLPNDVLPRSAQTGRVEYLPWLRVVHADVLDWRPITGQTWDVIYFDIWPTMSQDNLPQIARLHQRFKGRKRRGGWMNSWYADILRHQREEERRLYG